jgi:methionyl-tRNA synthetase
MKNRFYITTAISYPNGSPHIGHAYEAIAADVIARSKRMLNMKVRFVTGTDEHGLKMVQTARNEGVPVKTLADSKSALFEKMDLDLGVSFDRFVRTTSPDHHETAQKLWRRMKDDLYLDKYSGWYSVRDEAYFDEGETVVSDDGERFTKDGNPVEWIEEESWFFRLSAYGDRLKQHFEANPAFLQPEGSRNEILAMLDDLRDISVSRTTFDWGVPVPDSPGHVMYVWVDALANYLTGATVEFDEHWWPADLHVIGKDIAKFHAIYWPAFLMSADLALPEQVFCHGHLLHNGEKMSKSKGNVVDPFVVLKTVPADAIRYYLMSEITFGKDGDFVDARVIEKFNADLANGFGNLISRTCALIVKNGGKLPGVMPERDCDKELLAAVDHLCILDVQDAYARLELSRACREWMKAVNLCNAFIQTHEPWSKEHTPEDNALTLSALFRALQPLTAAISPIIPETAKAIQSNLLLPDSLMGQDFWYRWRGVSPDRDAERSIVRPPIFFPRLDANHA